MSAPPVHFLHNTSITNSGTQYTVQFGQQANLHVLGAILVANLDVPTGVNVNGLVHTLGFIYSGNTAEIGNTYGRSFTFNTWFESLTGNTTPFTSWGDLDIYLPPGALNIDIMLPSYVTGITSVVIVIAD